MPVVREEKETVLHWSDQPECLNEATSVCYIGLRHGRSIQVLRVRGDYYVTCGTLFGSTTISVKSADDAMTAIEKTAHLGSEGRLDPSKYGWTVVENFDDNDDPG